MSHRRTLLRFLAAFWLAPIAASDVTAQATVQSSPPAATSLRDLSLSELMEIEVTSVSREPEKLLEAPSAIQVITHDDIVRSGAETIPAALRLADNLDVAQKNSHDWGISARGFNTELSNKLLVMIDGRTVYTPLFSGVIWDAQDYLLEDLDRIEVISGPGGSVWGANAVNGVVSIMSRSARDTQGLYAEMSGGGLTRAAAAARYGGRIAPNVFFRVYGKSFERGKEELPPATPFSDAWRHSQGGFRIDADSANGDKFTLQGDLYSGHEGVALGGRNATSGRNVLTRWTHAPSDRSSLSLQAYYDHTHLEQPEPALIANGTTLAPAGRFRDDLDTFDVDFQQQIRTSGRSQTIWGLGYRYWDDSAGNAPSLGFLPPHRTTHLVSGFVQESLSLRPDLVLTAGSKVEHNDYTGLEFEPSVRLQWRRSEAQSFWAAVSRAVRDPSRIDRELSEGVPPNFVLLEGGRDFASETVIAYEAGWRAKLGARADASLSLFHDHYDELRSTSLTPTTVFPLFFGNDLAGETRGVEVTSTYQASAWLRLHAGYNFLKENIRVRPGKFDLNNALNETADPEQRASLRASIDFPAHVAFDGMLRWVGVRPGHDGALAQSLPGYLESDARLSWQGPRLELSVSGRNLLHDHHAEYGFPVATLVEIRRSVVAKVAVRY